VLGNHVLFKPIVYSATAREKKVKIQCSWTVGISNFEMCGWKTIHQVAEKRNGEHLLLRDLSS
jgi:hypothetical protein